MVDGAPVRIQLRRTKGWHLPAGAVSVARPTRWGNPYTVAELAEHWPDASPAALLDMVLSDFRGLVEGRWDDLEDTPTYPTTEEIVEHLKGRDLACWCPPGQPCHADILLEIANPGAHR